METGMRPAIDPRNIRLQQTSHRIRRTLTRWVFAYLIAITIAVVFVHLFDPELNPYL